MTAYLLIISLVLHFITFLILVLIIKRMRTSLDYEQLKIQKREIEDLLAFYAVELKEENERFLEKIIEANERVQSEKEPLEEEQWDVGEIEMAEENSTEENSNEAVTEKTYEPSLEARALQLYSQGYKSEEIAKKLNKGHGEIELLLKFRHSK